jgi:photosystem II stability/assembly factor-like uncharacterized protein
MKRIFTQVIYITLLFITAISVSAQNQWEALGGPYGGYVERLYGSGNTLFMKSSWEYYKSTNAGASWTLVANLPNQYIYDLGMVSENKIYALEYSRLYKTENGGSSWSTVSTGKFFGVNEMQIGINEEIFVYGWNGLYVSTDQGENWTQIITRNVNQLRVSPNGDAFFSAQSPDNSSVYKIYRLAYPGNGVAYSLDTEQFVFEELDTEFLTLVNFGANAAEGRVRIGAFAGALEVELRFGAGIGQKAHRFLVPEGATTGVQNTDFSYTDYVDVPFEAWDVTNNRQLNVSFRDQGRDGVFNLVFPNFDGAAIEQSREFIFISDTDYNPNDPHPDIAVSGGHIHRIMYDFWPVLTEDFNWDPTNLPTSKFNFSYQSVAGTSSLIEILNPAQFYADNGLPTWSSYWNFRLAFDANGHVYFLDGQNVLGSQNNGNTWQSLRDGDLTYPAVFYTEGRLTVTPNGTVYFFNNNNRNVYKRTSFSDAWTLLPDKWPTGNFSDGINFVINTSNETIIAGSNNFGPFKTTNASSALDWQSANTGITALLGENMIVTGSGRKIFFKQYVAGYWFSDNDGTSWSFAAPEVNSQQLIKFLQDPNNPNILFAFGSNYVYKTLDGGNSWTRVNDQAYYWRNVAIKSSTELFGLVQYWNGSNWVHSIIASNDAGSTWNPVTSTGLPTDLGVWEGFGMDVTADNKIFFQIYDYNTGLYRLWKHEGTTASIVTLPLNEGEWFSPTGVFVQDGTKVFCGSGNAIYVSENSGVNWTRLAFQNQRIINLGEGLGVSRNRVFQVTQDGGKTWTNTSLASGYITSVAKDGTGVYYAASSRSSWKFTQDLILDPSELPPFIDFNWTAQNGPQGGTYSSMSKFSDGKLIGAQNTGALRKSDGYNQPFTQITNSAFSVVYPASVFVDSNDKVYMLARSTADNLNYIFSSTDRGINWTKATVVYPGNSGHIFRKDIDGNLIGAGQGNVDTQGLFFSTDEGNSWTRKFSDVLFRYATDEEGNYFACYPYFESNNIGYGLMRSTDGGETWEEINNGISSKFSLNIVVDIEGNLLTHDNYSVYKSTDKGDTWMDITPPLTGHYFWTQEQILISPENHYYFFNTNASTSVTSAPRKLFKSINGGVSWTEVPNGHPQAGTIGGGFFADGNIILRVTDSGILYSNVENISWNANTQGLPGLNQTRILKLESRLFVTTGSSMFRSTDNGENWTSLGLPATRFLKISENEAIAYGQAFIYKTTDAGASWQPVVNRFLTSIAFNGTIYYATEGTNIYFSTDLTNWTNFNIIGMPDQRFIEQVGIDADSRVYYKLYDYADQQYKLFQILFGSPVPLSIIDDGWSIADLFYRDGKFHVFDRRGNLFYTADGLNWESKVTPGGNRIVIDRDGEYYFILSSQGLVWLSRDQGQTWQNVSSSNTSLSFNDVVINEYDGRAYAAVAGGTVHKSANVILPDDGTPPVVQQLLPSGSGAGLKPQLKITFDEVITPVDGKQLRLVKVGPPEQTIEFINVTTGVVDGFTVTLDINATLEFQNTYYILMDAGAFTDMFGNPVAAINSTSTWRFTTIAQPQVFSLDPVNNAVGQGLRPVFKVTFDKSVTAAPDKFLRIYTEENQAVPLLSHPTSSSIAEGNTISFAPFASDAVASLDFSKALIIKFDDGSFSAGGTNRFSALNNFTSWKINTRAKPVLSSLSPIHNASGVALSLQMTLTFAEPVSTVGGKMIRVYSANDAGTPVFEIDIAEAEITGNSISFEINQPLDFSTTYNVLIEPLAFQAEGRAFSYNTTLNDWNFTTRAKPAIASTSPSNNSSGASLLTDIVVTFQEQVQLVADRQISVYESANPAEAIAIFNVTDAQVSGNAITYNLSDPLKFSTQYFVKFDANSFSAFGREFSQLTVDSDLVFTTRGIPQVSALVPQHNGADVELTTPISITFNETVGMDTDKTVRVYDTSDESTPLYILPLSTANQSGNTIQLTSGVTLEYDKEYFVRVDEGAFSVEGVAFNILTTGDNWNFSTLTAPDTEAPVITNPGSIPKLAVGSATSRSLTIEITDNVGVQQAKIFYRGIVTSNNAPFTELNMTAPTQGHNFTAEIPASAFDAMGVEFYATAVDAAGNSSRSPSNANQFHYSYKDLSNADPDMRRISGLITGGAQNSYRIRTASYELQSTNFQTALGLTSYNKASIRIFRVNPGTASNASNPYIELNTSGFTGIERGQGYFINSKDAASFTIAGASTPPNNRNTLFTLNLKAGWNMIGNPYPVALNWNDVRANHSSVAELNIFEGTWSTSNQNLQPNMGGLVFVGGSADVNIQVPIPGITAGGRFDNSEAGTNLDEAHWELPITFVHGDVTNNLPGIGMHPEASELFDRFDNPTLPRFFDFAEINFARNEPMAPYFTKDVVPTQREYTWEFTFASNQEGLATFNWDNSDLGNSKDLVLFDVSKQLVLDMKASNTYTFDPKTSSSFRIYFGDNLGETLKPDRIMLGNAYPNPGRSEARVPFNISAEAGNVAIVMEIYNNLGVKIGTIVEGNFEPGFHEAQFDANSSDLSNGMYLIKLSVAGADVRETHYTKWILNR